MLLNYTRSYKPAVIDVYDLFEFIKRIFEYSTKCISVQINKQFTSRFSASVELPRGRCMSTVLFCTLYTLHI